MAVTVLASSLLLALVVTARPILPNANDVPQVGDTPLDVRDALQSVFEARIGQPVECLGCEGDKIELHVTTAEEQDAVLSGLDDIEAIKAIVTLSPDDSLTEEEKKLYELLEGHASAQAHPASLDDIDGDTLIPPVAELITSPEGLPDVTEASPQEKNETTLDPYAQLVDSLYDFGSSPLIILAFSCFAASLALGCLLGVLYLKYRLCGASEETLEYSPPREKSAASTDSPDDSDSFGGEKLGLLFLDAMPSEPSGVIVTSEDGEINEKIVRVDEAYYNQYDYSSDEDPDEVDEKYHDAFASPYMHSNPSLPRISVDYSDPDLLPLPIKESATPYSTPPHTPPRSTLRRLPSQLSMRESRPSTPLSKPAWSLRASNAPPLGLSASPSASPMMRAVSPEPVSLPIPGAFVAEDTDMVERPEPRRAYRAPMPELDLAFAMQLRPGMGMGSDPAWLVRFLMTMFGWMTVLIGGNPAARRSNQLAIMA
ncbi:hypothetical protein PsYK624_124800 [Phanerochaete sordida]|uniref:Transmembrane protein n=1 Tax=Phanerochaete sordida TaxID=48140 RepID=A0A9P3GK72_9APHY|nr:hypothetical protein PsYK624_124800 [Phanerochaete sordida]